MSSHTSKYLILAREYLADQKHWIKGGFVSDECDKENWVCFDSFTEYLLKLIDPLDAARVREYEVKCNSSKRIGNYTRKNTTVESVMEKIYKGQMRIRTNVICQMNYQKSDNGNYIRLRNKGEKKPKSFSAMKEIIKFLEEIKEINKDDLLAKMIPIIPNNRRLMQGKKISKWEIDEKDKRKIISDAIAQLRRRESIEIDENQNITFLKNIGFKENIQNKRAELKITHPGEAGVGL